VSPMGHDYRPQSDMDEFWMSQALLCARKAKAVDTAFSVGCVIIDSREQQIVTSGYSRQFDGNTHAEECALSQLEEKTREHLVLYTTMEPCSQRLSGKKSCVQRIIASRIPRVVFGCREPRIFVECNGADQLKQAGIQVDFLKEFESSCLQVNSHLIPQT